MIKLLDPLTEEEQNKLLEERGNSECKERLILHNLKLVYWVIRRYYSKDPRLEEDDLFQEGVIGLVKAIERYDPEKGKFGNFAVWDIRGSINRALENKADVIRIPSYLRQKLTKLNKITHSLELELYREPTSLEIASKMGISESEVRNLQTITKEPISLQYPLNTDGENLTLEDNIEDPSSPGYEEVEDRIWIENFKKIIKSKLTTLEYNTLVMIYGLDNPMYSVEEIAKALKKEPKTIQDIRTRALRKIRRINLKSSFERELDDNTIFIHGVDYTRPRVKGGEYISPVERIVLQREKQIEKLQRRD